MATSAKKAKPAGTKKPAQGKASKKPAPKKIAAPRPKRAAQGAVKPKITAKAPQRETPADKKITEAGKAFEKKIDQISTAIQKPEDKPAPFPKAVVAAIIIVVLAAVAYLYYPGKKSSVVKEEAALKEPVTPAPEAKVVEPKKEVPKPKTEDGTIYRVKPKDQLTEISKQVLGSTKEWKRIYEANKDKINNPNLIFPGQELIIPKTDKKDK